jgi:hypothetical protein
MKQLTEEQISRYKKLARKKTSVEDCGDEWNIREITGGRFNEAYAVGLHDSDIENARVILDVLGIDY